jgi:hypothetical protein
MFKKLLGKNRALLLPQVLGGCLEYLEAANMIYGPTIDLTPPLGEMEDAPERVA